MTSSEFAEWQAYYADEPFGDLRDDFRIGILDSLVANLMAGKGKKAAEPIDFVIHSNAGDRQTALKQEPKVHTREERRQSQQAQINEIKAFQKTRGNR